MEKIKQLINQQLAKQVMGTKLHYAFAGLYIVQAAMILVYSKAFNFAVQTNYLAMDPLLSSGDKIVHTIATTQLLEINLMWLVCLMMLSSALGYLLLANWPRITRSLNSKNQRSIGTASGLIVLALGFMVMITAILSGVRDFSTIILLAATYLSGMSLLARQYRAAPVIKNNSWQAQSLIYALTGLPWVVIIIYIIGTNIYGGSSIPAFVYWMSIMTIATQGLFTRAWLAGSLRAKGSRRSTSMNFASWPFLWLLVVQSIMAWQIFFGKLLN